MIHQMRLYVVVVALGTFPILKKVSQYTSNLYCNTPPIRIALLLVPLHSEEREILSALLPFISQYAPHLHCNIASHFYRSAFGKILVVEVTGMFPISVCDSLQQFVSCVVSFIKPS